MGIDPLTAAVDALAARAAELLGHRPPISATTATAGSTSCMSHIVEPELGRNCPTFVFDFPASQAALARIRPGDPPVAERFEAWIDGVELANGYHELTDAAEQRRRFEADLGARRDRGLPEVPSTNGSSPPSTHGMPDCAGVALGVDRLVMLAAGVNRIDEVIAFPVDRA